MCGIIGYIGHQKASPILINGLLRLEYRGYDSAGISTIEKNEVKIIDYGLSKIIDFSTITSTGKAVGSPLYMSPEQVMDSKSIDERSDIYALGIILYEMITGHVPYKPPAPYLHNLQFHT